MKKFKIIPRMEETEIMAESYEDAMARFAAAMESDMNVYFKAVDATEQVCLEVPTSAGVLKAYKSADPGQPGIVTMLQPAGYDAEIDTTYVSVYEDPGYVTSDGERPVDVSIMTYGDAYSEDYTSKVILRREDVQAALNGEQPGEWSREKYTALCQKALIIGQFQITKGDIAFGTTGDLVCHYFNGDGDDLEFYFGTPEEVDGFRGEPEDFVYEKGVENVAQMLADSIMEMEDDPCFEDEFAVYKDVLEKLSRLPEWECTDRDTLQFARFAETSSQMITLGGKTVPAQVWDYIQFDECPDETGFVRIEKGLSLADLSEEEINCVATGYYKGGIEDVIKEYPSSWQQILIECAFEQDAFCTPSTVKKYQSYEAAEEAIERYIA